MRISTIQGDRGYLDMMDREQRDIRLFATVTLDGEPQRFCLMADEEAGEVTRYRTDALGRPAIDGDRFVTETVRGRVAIRLPDMPRTIEQARDEGV